MTVTDLLQSVGILLLAVAGILHSRWMHTDDPTPKGTFGCAVDDCPMEFTDRDAHNRHSRAMHTQWLPSTGEHRYPGVDDAGDFRWYPA